MEKAKEESQTKGEREHTLESSNRVLVSASTSLSSPTESILVLTASVWLALETFRISVTFYPHQQHRPSAPNSPAQRGPQGQKRPIESPARTWICPSAQTR